jgi:hypothetical protein
MRPNDGLLPPKMALGLNAAAPLMDRSYSLVSLMLLAMTYANGFDEFFEPFAWSAMLNGMI